MFSQCGASRSLFQLVLRGGDVGSGHRLWPLYTRKLRRLRIRADFATTVFIGDSLTAGFQNGSLLDSQQPNGYASLIAKQAGFKLALPLIAPPGARGLQLVSVGPPPVIQQASGTSTGRDDLTVQATDLAVPGHLLTDLINRKPDLVPPATKTS